MSRTKNKVRTMGVELSHRRDISYNANLAQGSERLCNLAKPMQLVGGTVSSKDGVCKNISHRKPPHNVLEACYSNQNLMIKTKIQDQTELSRRHSITDQNQ